MSILFSFPGTVKKEYLSEVVFYYGVFSHLAHQHIFYLQEFPLKHIREDFSPVGESLLVRPLLRVLLAVLLANFQYTDRGRGNCNVLSP